MFVSRDVWSAIDRIHRPLDLSLAISHLCQERFAKMTEVAPAPVENLSTHDVASNEQASTEVKTVFHDPQAFTVKHPLINKWTLWYTKPPSAGQRGVDAWADNLKEVITFDSVEEFWGCDTQKRSTCRFNPY